MTLCVVVPLSKALHKMRPKIAYMVARASTLICTGLTEYIDYVYLQIVFAVQIPD